MSVPVATVFSAAKGMQRAMEILRDEGRNPSAVAPELLFTFSQFTDLMGLPEYNRLREVFKKNEV